MPSTTLKVIDGDGFYGIISDAELLQGEQVPVTLDDGKTIYVQSGILKEVSDGVYGIPISFKNLTKTDSEKSHVIPLVQENLDVRKTEINKARVVVNKIIHEREVKVDEPLLEENVRVERIHKNTIVDSPIPTRQEGDTIIISLVEEVLVVEKRLMLKEEVRIIKDIKEVHKPQTVTLQSEEVEIQRIPFQNDAKSL
ncbi:MAG TPA: YsnF/AvaK domain-containing protein [Patescibacteria group bacterium]|nr:YsnF/AvaK domain-containing protein [Patescibacteria group bacterium]